MEDISAAACCCIGKQNNEPFCPCEMRRRGIIKRGDQWVEPERVVGEVVPSFDDLKKKLEKYESSTPKEE